MRKIIAAITSIFILSLYANSIFAQTPTNPSKIVVKTVPAQLTPAKKYTSSRKYVDTVKNNDFSLNGQYQFMLSRSKSINGYKLINPTRLSAVWQSVTDTIKKQRADLSKSNSKIAEQQKTINLLQSEVSGNESKLNDTNAKMDEISFLGLSFTKGTYNIIVWSIIIVLAIALFVVITRSAKNIIEAKNRTELYEEISAEYQAFKTKSNEQQRKLARELQDERNTIEEMKSKDK